MGLVAGRDENKAIDQPLAEVKSTLAGGPEQAPVGPDDRSEHPVRRELASRSSVATTAAVASAVVVWVMFAVLPFLRATSGGVSTFPATLSPCCSYAATAQIPARTAS